jgi:antitoxin component YwqK of YwqJK toxin-antitoxin module
MLQYLTSASWWRTQGLVRLRGFFIKLFDIRPRNEKDYYGMGRWLVSKRLAFAVVVAIGVASLYYILVFSPVAAVGKASKASLPVFTYNSLPLRFYDGAVRIKARDGHIAYEGAIKRGVVTGSGQLFDKGGNTLYDGEFKNNMYNGIGILFFPGGGIRYEGNFQNNLMNGEGKLYAESGSLLYEGEFLKDMKNGQGKLYNAAATQIYEGNFVLDRIQYEEFAGKDVSETANMYLGEEDIYMSDKEFVVFMKEIGAVCSVASADEDIEGESKITGITVLDDEIGMGDKTFDSISELSSYFGDTDYAGYTWAMLPDAVAVNALGADAPIEKDRKSVV